MCSLLLPIKTSVKRGLLSLEHGLSELKKIQQSLKLPHVTDGESEVQKGEGIHLRSQSGAEEEFILESTSADLSLRAFLLWVTLLRFSATVVLSCNFHMKCLLILRQNTKSCFTIRQLLMNNSTIPSLSLPYGKVLKVRRLGAKDS